MRLQYNLKLIGLLIFSGFFAGNGICNHATEINANILKSQKISTGKGFNKLSNSGLLNIPKKRYSDNNNLLSLSCQDPLVGSDKNCLQFDGNDDYVSVIDSQQWAKSGSSFTISAWVKSSDETLPNKGIVSNYPIANKRKPFFMIGFDRSRVWFWLRDNQEVEAKAGVAKSHLLDGEWHYITGVRDQDSSLIKLYIDGELMAVANDSAGSCRYRDKLSFMRHFGRFTQGHLGEVRIWNEARTANQIQQFHCKSLAPSQLNHLIGYWQFNESKGKAVQDYAHLKNGTLKPNEHYGPERDKNQYLTCSNKNDNAKLSDCQYLGKQAVDTSQGNKKNGKPIASDRSKPNQALTSVDKDFYSLGLQDSAFLTVGFDSMMTGQLTIYEATWNSKNFLEKADVYVSADSENWLYVGEADNQTNLLCDIHPYTFDLDTLRYQYVKLVEKTDQQNFGGNADGFDVDAVCAEKIASIQKPLIKPECHSYGVSVINADQGTKMNGNAVDEDRSDSTNVLGKPDKQFYSLGFGDSASMTVAFDSFMTGKLSIYETSWNSKGYPEKARIYVSSDKTNWQFVGLAHNQYQMKAPIHPFGFNLDSLRFKYVKIVNASDSNQFGGSDDGFDVDAICAESVASVQAAYHEPVCQYYGDTVLDYQQGAYKNGTSINPNRSAPQNALGKPGLPIYSLGFQHQNAQKPYIIIGFQELMTGKLSVYEHNNNPLETADVYVSPDTQNWVYVGKAHNYDQANGHQFVTTFNLDTLSYQYVKLVNTTDKTPWGPKGDGFDLLGVCAEEKVESKKITSSDDQCFSINHVFTNKNGDGSVTKRYAIANRCRKSWQSTSFELPRSSEILNYRAGKNHVAGHTIDSPFYGIQFRCNRTSCLVQDTSWVQFTAEQNQMAGQPQILIESKATPQASGFDQPNKAYDLRAFPKPVPKGEPLKVRWQQGDQNYAGIIRMVNFQGEVVKAKKLAKAQHSFELGTQSLEKGLYIVEVGRRQVKIIVH